MKVIHKDYECDLYACNSLMLRLKCFFNAIKNYESLLKIIYIVSLHDYAGITAKADGSFFLYVVQSLKY